MINEPKHADHESGADKVESELAQAFLEADADRFNKCFDDLKKLNTCSNVFPNSGLPYAVELNCYLGALEQRNKKMADEHISTYVATGKTCLERLIARFGTKVNPAVQEHMVANFMHSSGKDLFGNVPLIAMVDIGHVENGRWVWHPKAKEGMTHLLTAKTDPNTAGKFDDHALAHAVIVGNHEAVDLLLGKGADVNSPCAFGGNVLHWAECALSHNPHSADHLQIRDMLIKHGVDQNKADSCGKTPKDYK